MILFIISLFITIIIHEFGHLIIAKLCKCPVERISFGFGKTIFKIKTKQIIYRLALLPIGGDCQLKGERYYCIDEDAFCNLSYRKKVFISLAGCIVNSIIGFISYLIGIKVNNNFLIYLGYLNLIAGISGLIPIPCLDGSMILFVWLQKLLGHKRGYLLFIFINRIALLIWITITVLCIPYLIYLIKIGAFK